MVDFYNRKTPQCKSAVWKLSRFSVSRYVEVRQGCDDFTNLAQRVKQERAFLFRALSLVNLAPDIIEAILNGIRPSPKATAGQEEPATLTLSKLRKGFPRRLERAVEDVWNVK